MCCLFRVCCYGDQSDDEDTTHNGTTSSRHSVEPVAARMTRQDDMTNSFHNYQVVATMPTQAMSPSTSTVSTALDVLRDADEEVLCCHTTTTTTPPREDDSNNNTRESRINGFLRRLQENWRKYDTLETFPTSEAVSLRIRSTVRDEDEEDEKKPKSVKYPLRAALQFESAKDSDYPTIRPEEVVLPGSTLQKEMSKAMAANLAEQGDECVICMEGFDATNPRMPTLCGCGENRTYFHLPCLYQWVEQSNTCPSCRQHLRWEEF